MRRHVSFGRRRLRKPKLRADAIEKAKQADVVVMVMGISPSIEGEEMPSNLKDFAVATAPTFQLPKPQLQLIKDIHALGKPVILVTMGGSALAMNWEDQNIPAILHAWYPRTIRRRRDRGCSVRRLQPGGTVAGNVL
jgi:beta-glucosidase